MVRYYRENYTFPKIQRGPTFNRGGPTVQMLISIETHITCDFSGGVRTPIPPYPPPPPPPPLPLDPRMIFHTYILAGTLICKFLSIPDWLKFRKGK